MLFERPALRPDEERLAHEVATRIQKALSVERDTWNVPRNVIHAALYDLVSMFGFGKR